MECVGSSGLGGLGWSVVRSESSFGEGSSYKARGGLGVEIVWVKLMMELKHTLQQGKASWEERSRFFEIQ